MSFANDKKMCLEKLKEHDKSKKGAVDEEILPLVEKVNSLPSYYTTSSCSGRIMLMSVPPSGKKHECAWLYVSHSFAKEEDIHSALKELPPYTIWLRMEAPILHICAEDTASAAKLLETANKAGFRRAGIISLSRRPVIEICGPEKLNVPVASEGRLLVSEDYIRYLIDKSNSFLFKSRKRMEKLHFLLSQV